MTDQQISITFTADEEMDESHFMNYGFSPSFSPLSSPKRNQPTHAALDDHEIPLDGCFSSMSFDWNVGLAEEPQTAAAQFSACSRDSQPLLPFYDACSSVASLRHQEMQQPLTMEQKYPSLYAAQPPPATPKAPFGFLSTVQQFSCDTTSADNAHLPYNGTVTDPNPSLSTLVESAQFYSAMLQATLDRTAAVAQQQQLLACPPYATPSNTETVELCSVDVAPSDPPRSNIACGSPDFEFFCDEQPDQKVQEVQLSLKSSSQLKEDKPEFNPDVSTSTSAVESNLGQDALQDEDHHPTCLSIPVDQQFLDPVHNFLRSSCVEVFVCGNNTDARGRGRGAKCKEGQIGLRCAFCKDIPKRERANQAVSYPSKTAHIFESVRNHQRIHFDACEHIPTELKMKHRQLVSKKSTRKVHLKYVKVYFAEAACEIGMVETANGLFFGAPPNTSGTPSEKLRAIMRLAENPSAHKDQSLMDLVFPKVDERVENSKFSHIASANTRQVIDKCRQEKAAFVFPSDFPTLSDFRFVLFHQFVPCRPSASALGRSKVKAENWDTLSGLCCKHCARAHQGEDHGGLYFPLDLESRHDSSFLHHLTCHMVTCQHVPLETREALEELQNLAAVHGAITKRGAKRMFLKKLWNRMSNYYSSP